MGGTRRPAVAGTFYPGERGKLEEVVRNLLEKASPRGEDGPVPKALIAPHAGYVYSGPIAASAYARVAARRAEVERVVLLGPAHRVAVRGLAAPEADRFATPLGDLPLDRGAVDRVLRLPQVVTLDAAHAAEHSLEVHLPFIQALFPSCRIVPLVVGDATPQEVGEVLELLWGGPETLLVVSSDLSHYYDYATARRMDAATTRAIEALDPDAIGFEQACGRIAVQGMLLAARRHGLRARAVDVRNSGDTADPRDSVVGYGAYVFA